MNRKHAVLAAIACAIALSGTAFGIGWIDSAIVRNQQVLVTGPAFGINGTFPAQLIVNVSVSFILTVTSQVATLTYGELFFAFEATNAACSWFAFELRQTRPNGSFYYDPLTCGLSIDNNTGLNNANLTLPGASFLSGSSITYPLRITIKIVAVYALIWGLKTRSWT